MPDELEYLLLPTAGKTPSENAGVGHHRFASEERGLEQVPLGAYPIMMKITRIEEHDGGAGVKNDFAAHFPRPSM